MKSSPKRPHASSPQIESKAVAVSAAAANGLTEADDGITQYVKSEELGTDDVLEHDDSRSVSLDRQYKCVTLPPVMHQPIVDRYKAMLQGHKNLDLRHIDYEAKNGTLVLSGNVHSAHERAEAVRRWQSQCRISSGL